MSKEGMTKILLTLPVELQETLRKEGRDDHRSLNNYIITLLLNRKKGK